MVAEYARVDAADWPIAAALRKRSWGLTDFRLHDPNGYFLRVTGR